MRPTIATFVAISVIVSAVVAVLTAGRSMRSRLLLAFICSTTLLSITLFAQQELGNQGTDPFTGRPAVPSVPSNAGNGNAPGSPSAEEEHRLVFKSDLELTPGDYQVRFVIRDNLSGRIGSVSVPLTVN